ncbi:GDP-mannose 4,6-dehydratase [Nocardioides panaciterrulae]|uniref:GDP-mannose 4,6-dehydratase n=1 Tax=Nocardioides panaciterrulae TaxID=661492 RepID=A0A7Y9E3V5_9ACTN|nr:GDP-mannose 4,6-dehydratase [Nocardioides panaciterrulae]NYD40487.1 GDPmannose 4,6-dehydratase [Nocardioides panaciterrulae]
MARAFITGATGQDGSYLTERLLAEGTEVHALLQPGERPADVDLQGVAIHRGDLTDVAEVRRLLVDLAPGEVYNLAAVSSVARSWAEPDLTSRVNGLAAAALLESAWQAQEKSGRPVRVVQASSAEMFGIPVTSPQDEETPLRPVNPYGAAKAHAHLMVDVYRRRGLHAVSAIHYNHESPRRPRHFVTRKVTATVAAIARGRADRLQLGNLDARRDWGWAPDHVDAMVRAARADHPGDYVVATGTSRSVRDFVAMAFAHVGIAEWESLVSVDGDLLRPQDAPELVGNPARARRELGWAPTVAFDELVARMVDADLARLDAGRE